MKNMHVKNLIYDPDLPVPRFDSETKTLHIGNFTPRMLLEDICKVYTFDADCITVDNRLKRLISIYTAYNNEALRDIEGFNPWFWDDYAEKELIDVSMAPIRLTELIPEGTDYADDSDYVEFCKHEYQSKKAIKPLREDYSDNIRIHFGREKDHIHAVTHMKTEFEIARNPYYVQYMCMLIGNYSGCRFSPHIETFHPYADISYLRGFNLLMSLTKTSKAVINPLEADPPLGFIRRIIFNPDLVERFYGSKSTIVLNRDDPDYVTEKIANRIKKNTRITVVSFSDKRLPYQLSTVRLITMGFNAVSPANYKHMLPSYPVKLDIQEIKKVPKNIQYRSKGMTGVHLPFFESDGTLVYNSETPWTLLQTNLPSSQLNIDILNTMRQIADHVHPDSVLYRYILLDRITYVDILEGKAYPKPFSRSEIINMLTFSTNRVLYF